MIAMNDIWHEFPTPQGERIAIFNGLSLSVGAGEAVSLVGPSGCGKTTLLNMMAGFIRPWRGTVEIAGEPVVAPDIRRVTVFQNYNLLPWRTAQHNIELGLERKGLSRKERHRIAEARMKQVGLLAFRKHHPHQLSGGMQQRVAIARALAVQPEALFMDEPFGALDAVTRRAMQKELQNIRREQACTIVFVTHDIDEAALLSDRIIVLSHRPGRILAEVVAGRNLDRTSVSPDFYAARCAVSQAIEPWRCNPDFSI